MSELSAQDLTIIGYSVGSALFFFGAWMFIAIFQFLTRKKHKNARNKFLARFKRSKKSYIPTARRIEQTRAHDHTHPIAIVDIPKQRAELLSDTNILPKFYDDSATQIINIPDWAKNGAR